MGPVTVIAAIFGVYTSMLWLTGRRLKEATEAFLRREEELARREEEMLRKIVNSERPMEY